MTGPSSGLAGRRDQIVDLFDGYSIWLLNKRSSGIIASIIPEPHPQKCSEVTISNFWPEYVLCGRHSIVWVRVWPPLWILSLPPPSQTSSTTFLEHTSTRRHLPKTPQHSPKPQPHSARFAATGKCFVLPTVTALCQSRFQLGFPLSWPDISISITPTGTIIKTNTGRSDKCIPLAVEFDALLIHFWYSSLSRL